MFFGKMGHRQGRWEGLFDKSKRIRDRRMRLYMCTSPLRARDTLPQFYITCYISNISNDHLLLSVEKIKVFKRLKQPCHGPPRWIGPVVTTIRSAILSLMPPKPACPDIPRSHRSPFSMRCRLTPPLLGTSAPHHLVIVVATPAQ